MPNGEDRERINQRLDMFEGIIRREWPEANIARDPRDPLRIRVETDNQQETSRDRVAIVFETDQPLMFDTNVPYERMFDMAIQQAKRVFNEVPNDQKNLSGNCSSKVDRS